MSSKRRWLNYCRKCKRKFWFPIKAGLCEQCAHKERPDFRAQGHPGWNSFDDVEDDDDAGEEWKSL